MERQVADVRQQHLLVETIRSWDESMVIQWLESMSLDRFLQRFIDHNITGDILLELDHNLLKEMEISTVGDRMRILIALKQLKTKGPSSTMVMSYGQTDTSHQEQEQHENTTANYRKANLSISTSPKVLAHHLYSPETPVLLTGSEGTPSADEFSKTQASPSSSPFNQLATRAGKHSAPLEGGAARFNTLNQHSSSSKSNLHQTKTFDPPPTSAPISQHSLNLSSSARRMLRVLTEDGQSRVIQVTDLQTIQQLCCKIFHKFGILQDSKDLVGAERERSNFAFYLPANPANPKEYLRLLSDDELIALSTNLSTGEMDTIPTLLLKRRFVGMHKKSSSKLNDFFGEAVPDSPPTASTGALTHAPPPFLSQTKLKNFFGNRPPSELITGNLTQFFPDMVKPGSDGQLVAPKLAQDLSEDESPDEAGPRKYKTLQSSSSVPNLNSGNGPNGTLKLKSAASTARIPQWAQVATQSPISGASSPVAVPPSPSSSKVFQAMMSPMASSPNSSSATPRRTNTTGRRKEPKKIKWIKGAQIGTGSFGTVYLGLNGISGAFMAVKQVQLPDEDLMASEDGTPLMERKAEKVQGRRRAMFEALQREIGLLKELEHPNIVRYLGSEHNDQFLNIFLEYVPGGSVASILSNYGAFEEALVKTFVRQILHGLNYLHEKSIVHRDIKGGNILIDNKGVVKISDFGISKKVVSDRMSAISMYPGVSNTVANRKSALQGSVFWMAPEVVKSHRYSKKSDIWGVGCLVIEMLTGEHPWPDLTQMQAIFKIGSGEAPPLPANCSNTLRDFEQQCLEIKYKDRPDGVQILNHPFLVEDESSSTESLNPFPSSFN